MSDERPAPPRRGRSFFEVALAFVTLGIIALVAGVAIYLRMIRYEEAAALHLPPDTELAARVDVENVELFEPMRKHLLPLVNELLPPDKPAATPRLARIKDKAGIDLALDLREVVVARGPSSRDVVVLLGGKFPKGGAVAAMDAIFRDEGHPWQRSSDGRTLTGPSGVSFAQAEDGTLILAASSEGAVQALPRGITWERIGLSLNGPISVSAKARSLDDWLATLTKKSEAIGRIGRVQRVTGEVTFTGQIQSRLVLRMAPGTEVSGSERALDSGLRALADSGFSPIAGERDALAKARVSSPATGILELIMVWKPENLDQAAAALARSLRRQFGAAGGAPSGP